MRTHSHTNRDSYLFRHNVDGNGSTITLLRSKSFECNVILQQEPLPATDADIDQIVRIRRCQLRGCTKVVPLNVEPERGSGLQDEDVENTLAPSPVGIEGCYHDVSQDMRGIAQAEITTADSKL